MKFEDFECEIVKAVSNGHIKVYGLIRDPNGYRYYVDPFPARLYDHTIVDPPSKKLNWLRKLVGKPEKTHEEKIQESVKRVERGIEKKILELIEENRKQESLKKFLENLEL